MVLRLSNKLHDNLFNSDNNNHLKQIKYTVNITSNIEQHNINTWIKCLESSNVRAAYINKGIEYAELYLNYKIN